MDQSTTLLLDKEISTKICFEHHIILRQFHGSDLCCGLLLSLCPRDEFHCVNDTNQDNILLSVILKLFHPRASNGRREKMLMLEILRDLHLINMSRAQNQFYVSQLPQEPRCTLYSSNSRTRDLQLQSTLAVFQPAAVFSCCCSKSLKTWWLNTHSYLTVPQVRSPSWVPLG